MTISPPRCSEELQNRRSSHVGINVDVTWQVTNVGANLFSKPTTVAFENPRRTRIGAEQAKQNSDRGCLPGSVGAKESDQLSFGDAKRNRL